MNVSIMFKKLETHKIIWKQLVYSPNIEFSPRSDMKALGVLSIIISTHACNLIQTYFWKTQPLCGIDMVSQFTDRDLLLNAHRVHETEVTAILSWSNGHHDCVLQSMAMERSRYRTFTVEMMERTWSDGGRTQPSSVPCQTKIQIYYKPFTPFL